MTDAPPRSFLRVLAAVLAAGLLARVAYVLLQPRYDPTFARPILDGAYYVQLARSWWDSGLPSTVFYMPPLYPALLAPLLALFGSGWGALYLVQHALVVAAAGAMGVAGERIGGSIAGWSAAALVLLYHPALFFASRPLGEAWALALLAAAVALALRDGAASSAAAGLAAGLCALVRPNLLPLPALWAVREAWRRAPRAAVLLVAAATAVVLPVAAHNLAASGRLVPVSANGGVVFWLGNAPDAVGVYTPAEGFSGRLATQQEEAIAEGSRRAGRPLDAVEADRFWWREGLRERGAHPLATAALLVRRLGLTLDNAEHGLDYAPSVDAHPFRWVAPVPFAILLGLAAAGVVARGFRGTGGGVVWSAVAVAALAPVAFYASSRHRLPLAMLLALPAGVAVAAVPTLTATGRGRVAIASGALASAVSFALPTGSLVRGGEAGALAVLADVELRNGDAAAARGTARRATAIDPGCTLAWYNLGVIENASGRLGDAERAYRRALAIDPGHAGAAGNLAALLLSSGRSDEAVALLQDVLPRAPRDETLWTNLVVGLVQTGRVREAQEVVGRAEASGIPLNPGLVREVREMKASP